jgi:uncharacterized protein YhbP (UPF0306 family)
VDATRERLLSFLRKQQVVTVAVVEPEGTAHAAALFYAVDDELNLYVLTEPASRHGQAMARTGLVAGTIQRDRQEWQWIQGVQFRGRCRRLTGAARERGWNLFAARFPFVQHLSAAGLAQALGKTALWQIEPAWMRLINNRRGFGRKEEWTRET